MHRTKSPVIETVIKRDGEIVPFEQEKTAHAVAKAFDATGERSSHSRRPHGPNTRQFALVQNPTVRLNLKLPLAPRA